MGRKEEQEKNGKKRGGQGEKKGRQGRREGAR